MASPTTKNLIAVVIGAVLLFGAISMIPIVIMRRHHRRAAERHANELRCLEANGTMRQVTVQRWLEQQTRSDNLDRYAGESCPICLTSLCAPSALSQSSHLLGSVSRMHHIHDSDNLHQTRPIPNPPQPDTAYMSSTITDDNRTQPPRSHHQQLQHQQQNPSSHPHERRTTGVLILNRCNHAFHTACLASWFQHHQYRCPICAESDEGRALR
ncbi:hypothetical protein BJY04DRAFT_20200 [Aspergillus karnatakaensis]|uniref:RING finger protein n=1 Tax=Aspergillus karnatakaensis TaxID=1810916 RepID=UPI003CCD469C